MLSEIHGYGINQKENFCKKSYQNLGAKFPDGSIGRAAERENLV